MTDKEQIIIDGEKEDCKILFRCKHIDDLAAYNMIRNGIKITPENAPIGDFELMLIENTDSPFGFSSVCKRNNKEDVWEYSGFGHSGACSIVTALLKRLARKTQECEELKEENQKLEMQLCNECGERDDYNIPCKMIRDLDYGLQMELEENACYRKALEGIEGIAKNFGSYAAWQEQRINKILDIINKAKGEECN